MSKIVILIWKCKYQACHSFWKHFCHLELIWQWGLNVWGANPKYYLQTKRKLDTGPDLVSIFRIGLSSRCEVIWIFFLSCEASFLFFYKGGDPKQTQTDKTQSKGFLQVSVNCIHDFFGSQLLKWNARNKKDKLITLQIIFNFFNN